MKYAVIDITRGDSFEEIFDTADEAVAQADYEWRIMSSRDKDRREAFYVASCEVDEDGCIDYNTVNLIQNYF